MINYKEDVQYLVKLKNTETSSPYEIAIMDEDYCEGEKSWIVNDMYLISDEKFHKRYIVVGEVEKIVDILKYHAARNPDGFPFSG